MPASWIDASALSNADVTIVWLMRLPRVLVAFVVGAGLSTAGVLMQGLFRNPLAEPSLTGVGPGAVLIRVERAAVNPVDWKAMAGGLDGLIETVFPAIPGWDVAGVVESVGPDTPEFSPGDRVASYGRTDVIHGGTFADSRFAVNIWLCG